MGLYGKVEFLILYRVSIEARCFSWRRRSFSASVRLLASSMRCLRSSALRRSSAASLKSVLSISGLLYNCNGLEWVELHGKEKREDYNDGGLFNVPGDLPKWNLTAYLRLYVTHDSEGEQMAQEKNIPYEYLNEKEKKTR